MKILVLGGTGAMGVPLVEILKTKEYKTVVTTRNRRESVGTIVYQYGNAKEINFLNKLLSDDWDVIVDFMQYNTTEFENRINLLLSKCKQYFFISSCRVYADSIVPIVESSARLLDITGNKEFLQSDNYSLEKARQENVLFNSKKRNWTIIRPYITYYTHRLQLGIFEKEEWLKRALNGQTIVLPKDIANAKTSITFGQDVARAIYLLMGTENALGEIYHVVNEETKTWNEILCIYINMIQKYTGRKCKIKYVDNSKELVRIWDRYIIEYDRLYDRIFDSSKIKRMCPSLEFSPIQEGIEKCICEFLDNINWRDFSPVLQAWEDKNSNEIMPLWNISIKDRFEYLYYRFIEYDFNIFFHEKNWNRILIYGLGKWGMNLYDGINEEEYEIVCLGDGRKEYYQEKLKRKVYNICELVDERFDVCIITSIAHSREIVDEFQNYGMPAENIILFSDLVYTMLIKQFIDINKIKPLEQ